MGFESPLFLIGASAAAVPVVLHLVFRVRRRRKLFGSVMFLTEALRPNRRRLRLRDLLLLLLRAGAFALIAMGFARPFLSGAEGGNARQDAVFVLDDTFSMRAAVLGRTLFEEAKLKLAEEVERLSPRDRGAIVLVSGGGKVACPLTGETPRLKSALRAARPTYAAGQIAPALRLAFGMVEDSKEKTRVVLASDLQAAAIDHGALKGLARGGAKLELIRLPDPGPNAAVTGLEAEGAFFSPGLPVKIRAEVSSFGAGEERPATVRLLRGRSGEAVSSRVVGLERNGRTEAYFELTPERTGVLRLVAELDGRDALPEDDARLLALRVRPRLRVLCLQDRVRRFEKYADESYFVRRALDPPGPGGESEGVISPFAAARSPVDLLEKRMLAFRGHEKDLFASPSAGVVFLLGDAVPGSLAASVLAEWVASGGGLLLAPSAHDGRRFDAEAYTRVLSESGLLPARPLERRDLGAGGLGLKVKAKAHPALRAFRGRDIPGRVFTSWELDVAEGAEVLLELADGSPALVASAREAHDEIAPSVAGKGYVLMLAFALDGTDSDLPRRRAFVPFVHGLAGFLAGTRKGPSRVPVRRDPYEPPGFKKAAGEPGTVALNVPESESDLRRAGFEEFLAWAGGTGHPGARTGKRSSRVPVSAAPERGSSRLWAVMLAAAVAMLLFESLIANKLVLSASTVGAGASAARPGQKEEKPAERGGVL